jgi:hypothetical protein
MYFFEVRILIVVDMSCSSNWVKVLLPAKWRPTNRIVNTKRIAYMVRCPEAWAFIEKIPMFILIVDIEIRLFLISALSFPQKIISLVSNWRYKGGYKVIKEIIIPSSIDYYIYWFIGGFYCLKMKDFISNLKTINYLNCTSFESM